MKDSSEVREKQWMREGILIKTNIYLEQTEVSRQHFLPSKMTLDNNKVLNTNKVEIYTKNIPFPFRV